MLNNTLEIIKGSIATLGLIGILMVSAFTVGALNPRAYNPQTDSQVAGPTVQGLSSDSDYLENINLENVFVEIDGVKTTFEKINNNQWEYNFEFKNGLKKDIAEGEYKFIKFVNNSDITIKYNLELESNSALENDLKINIGKGLDSIDIKNQEKLILSSNEKSEDLIRVKFDTRSSINYSFNVKFLITF